MKIVYLSLTVVFLFIFSIAAAAQNVGRLFIVTNNGDTSDVNPGNGLCADANGLCTLRAAVDEANGNLAERDIIIFEMAFPAVIDLTNGPLTITGNNTSIVGPGARRLTVQRSASAPTPFSIFTVPNADTNVVIRGLTVKNGIAGVFFSGGGIRIGPGASVNLAEMSFINNNAAKGGAISNEGSLTMTRSLIASNTASVEGGGISMAAGSVTRITNTTITANSAPTGGGIHAAGMLLSVNNTITHNAATSSASGIFSASGAAVDVLNTIVGADTSLPVVTLAGAFNSLGSNIVTDARGSSGFSNGVNNDQVSDNNAIDSLLGALADNGGQTDTRALLTASPAIDHGDSCVFVPGVCSGIPGIGPLRLIWDQRPRRIRSTGASVDVGAFESGSGVTTAFGGFSFTVGGIRPIGQAVLIDVATGERRYTSIKPSGSFRFSFIPGEAYVVDFNTKRGIPLSPFLLGRD